MCAEASTVLRAVAADFFLTVGIWRSLRITVTTVTTNCINEEVLCTLGSKVNHNYEELLLKETKYIVTPILYRSSTNVCLPLESLVVYLMHSCYQIYCRSDIRRARTHARMHAHSASDSVMFLNTILTGAVK
jgi:hypothetical protein